MTDQERLMLIVVLGFCIGCALSFALRDYPLARLLVDIALGGSAIVLWRRSMA